MRSKRRPRKKRRQFEERDEERKDQQRETPEFDADAFMRILLRAMGIPFVFERNVAVQAGIPPDMFRKLLMLCHPDKHGNSEVATEVTRWLIQQRELSK